MRFWTVFVAWTCVIVSVPLASAADDAATPGAKSFLEGLVALEAGQWAEAQEAFGAAIEEDEENAGYYAARGVAYVLGEKFPKAIKDLQRSLKLEPDNREVKCWLGVAFGMSGDFFQANNYFTHGKEMPADYASFIFNDMVIEYTDALRDGKKNEGRSRFARAAAWFVGRRKPSALLAGPLAELAQQKLEREEFADALADYESLLSGSPEDVELRANHAACLLALGRNESARSELTRVLTARTDDALAHLRRGLAAARMGDRKAAQFDLDSSAKASGKGPEAMRSQINEALASAPAEGATADKAWQALVEAAKAKVAWEELAELGLALRKVASAERRRYDEWYQRQLQRLEEKLKAGPKKVERIVALARFLYDESSVYRERVEPRAAYRMYRHQTADSQEREVKRAEALADQALELTPGHAGAIAVKASARMWFGQYADAESLLRPALKSHPDSAELLGLFSQVLEVASAQKGASAEELRRPKYMGSTQETWGSYLYTYTYWHYPSLEEQDRAADLEGQAQELVALAMTQIQKAAKAKQGTAEGHYFQALYHWKQGEPDAAIAEYQHAIKLEPKRVKWHFNLSGLLDAKGNASGALDERIAGLNLLESTCAPWLDLTWDYVSKTKWKSARTAMAKAIQLDGTDPRVPAYLGVVYAGDDKPEEAAAYFFAALAMEEARLVLDGKTLAKNSRDKESKLPLTPADVGLSLVLRRRLGALLRELDRPAEAAEICLAGVALESRLADGDAQTEVPSAMLPNAEMDPFLVPEADNLMALVAWNRVEACGALTQQGEHRKAIELMDWSIERYQKLMINGLGLDRLRGPELYAALYLARAYLALGELEQAQQYARMLPRARFGVGPSKGPFPELEAESTKLLEEIERRGNGGR